MAKNLEIITDYDRWKFRRCIETIRKNQCLDDCDVCKFNIEISKHISIASEDCYVLKCGVI